MKVRMIGIRALAHEGGRAVGKSPGITLSKLAIAAVASSLAFSAAAPSAIAQSSERIMAQQRIDIPAGPLNRSVLAISSAYDVDILVPSELVSGKRASALSGNFGFKQALETVLAGSGLTYTPAGDGAFVIVRQADETDDGHIQLNPITVEGGRNVGQTEGTGSYTTNAVTIGKTPASLRETPQSVSVITRQRMDDQNFTNLSEALRYTTGMVVFHNGSGDLNFVRSRGHNLDILRDGLSVRGDSGNSVEPDLAIYDRIEVLRGAAGLFKGVGAPGGSVNLARKRALAPFRITGQAGVGTWDAYRGEVDVTGALSESDRLRGRLVAVGEDRGSYLDNVESNKKLVYGTLEFDISDDTTLSVGGAYQDFDGIIHRGLPAFATGELLDVSRSTSLSADWTTLDSNFTQIFAELEHRIATGGRVKLSAKRLEVDTQMKILLGASGVAPDGSFSLSIQDQDRNPTETAFDIFLDTPFNVGGKTHDFLIGADYRKRETNFNLAGPNNFATANIFSFDANSITEPPDAPVATRRLVKSESYGVYSQLRIKPLDWLTVIGGSRLSWSESEVLNRITNTVSGKQKETTEFTPYGGLVVDLNNNLSLYGSYAEIFLPTSARSVDGSVLPPRVGNQIEAGVKGEFFGERLNAHAAVFRLDDENRSISDPNNPGFSIAAGKVRSQGFEAEVSGRITDRWDVAAGYAYTTTEHIAGTPGQAGATFSPETPKHSAHLWTNYRFGSDFLPGWDVGAGVRASSDFYGQSGNVRIEADGYTVASLAIGYQINDHFKATLNVDNLFDEKYYERAGFWTRSASFYGAPRSVFFNLKATW